LYFIFSFVSLLKMLAFSAGRLIGSYRGDRRTVYAAFYFSDIHFPFFSSAICLSFSYDFLIFVFFYLAGAALPAGPWKALVGRHGWSPLQLTVQLAVQLALPEAERKTEQIGSLIKMSRGQA
jgi:hypothetical protein